MAGRPECAAGIGFVLAALLGAIGGVTPAVDAQEEAISPPERPMPVLQFEAERLGALSLNDAGQDRVFCYLPYTLKNIGSQPVPLAIHITVVTDRLEELIDSYQPVAIDRIRRKVKGGSDGKWWTRAELDTPTVSGEMTWKQWSDRVREGGEPAVGRPVLEPGAKIRCVAVFRRWKPGTRGVTIRIRGLVDDIAVQEVRSGSTEETEWVPIRPPRPSDEDQTREPNEPNKRAIQVRLLELVYSLPPDARFARVDHFELDERRWRKEFKLIPTDLR
jgi:hypothetical protein